MSTTKFIIKIILFVSLFVIVLIGEYHLFYKKDFYSEIKRGTVIHSYESIGRRSSTCFATIKFDNGDIQEKNTGHYCYKIGDRFEGQLDWNPIIGINGLAYSWSPSGTILLFIGIAVLFNVAIVIFGTVVFFSLAF